MGYLEAERGLREPFAKSWWYSSVVGWILISTRGLWCFALQCWHSVRNFSSALHSNLTGDFQLFIRQQFMMMILPSSIRRHFVFSFVVISPICLKSPFSDQFPCLNLWGVCVCTSDWIGVKLFSRQCDSVSRRCFSAKQKINIYWQDSEGIFSVWSHLYPFCCKDKGHTRLVLFIWRAKVHPATQFLIICQWEIGCEPLTHMGNKTNGEPQIWVKRTASQLTLGI